MIEGKAIPVTPAAITHAPEPVRWTFREEAGILEFSGQGAIADYTTQSPPPWFSLREKIRHLEIGDGITRLGARTFRDCTALETAALADSVYSLGESCFENCESLTRVTSSRPWAHRYDRRGTPGADLTVITPEEKETKLLVSYRVFRNTPLQTGIFGQARIVGGVLVEFFGSTQSVRSMPHVSVIGPRAFEDLPVTDLPDGCRIREIGACAFRGTKLKRVDLSQTEKVGPWAFSNNPQLEQVTVGTGELDETAFHDTPLAHSGRIWARMKPTKGQITYAAHRKTWACTSLVLGIHRKRWEITLTPPTRELLQRIREGELVFRLLLDPKAKVLWGAQVFHRADQGRIAGTSVQVRREGWKMVTTGKQHRILEPEQLLEISQEGLCPCEETPGALWFHMSGEGNNPWVCLHELLKQWFYDHLKYRLIAKSEKVSDSRTPGFPM